MADYDELNKSIREWGKITSRQLQRRVIGITLKDRIALRKTILHKARNPDYKRLSASIGPAYKAEFGQIYRINFRFSRQGIFLEHGVGGKKGGGSIKHTPRPWIAPVLSIAIDQLADILATQYADLVSGEIKFVVPSIIDRRIKIENNG